MWARVCASGVMFAPLSTSGMGRAGTAPASTLATGDGSGGGEASIVTGGGVRDCGRGVGVGVRGTGVGVSDAAASSGRGAGVGVRCGGGVFSTGGGVRGESAGIGGDATTTGAGVDCDGSNAGGAEESLPSVSVISEGGGVGSSMSSGSEDDSPFDGAAGSSALTSGVATTGKPRGCVVRRLRGAGAGVAKSPPSMEMPPVRSRGMGMPAGGVTIMKAGSSSGPGSSATMSMGMSKAAGALLSSLMPGGSFGCWCLVTVAQLSLP